MLGICKEEARRCARNSRPRARAGLFSKDAFFTIVLRSYNWKSASEIRLISRYQYISRVFHKDGAEVRPRSQDRLPKLKSHTLFESLFADIQPPAGKTERLEYNYVLSRTRHAEGNVARDEQISVLS